MISRLVGWVLTFGFSRIKWNGKYYGNKDSTKPLNQAMCFFQSFSPFAFKVLGIHFLGLYSTVALLNCGQVKLNLVSIGSGLEKNHGSQFQCWAYVFADHPRIHDPLAWHPLGGSSF